jgi:hypothetical protein
MERASPTGPVGYARRVAVQLPLFPLGSVLFPGLVLPLHVFEERYRSLVRDLVGFGGSTGSFGVVAIRRGWEVERAAPGAPAGIGAASGADDLHLYEVGCTAEIRSVTEHPDGRFDLVTVGRRRFRVVDVDDATAPYLVARVEWIDESSGEPGTADALAPAVLAAFRRYLELIRSDSHVAEQLPTDPTVLSYLIAATAVLSLDDRQRLLAEATTVGRLRAERRLLTREAALLGRVRAVPVPLPELATPTSPN